MDPDQDPGLTDAELREKSLDPQMKVTVAPPRVAKGEKGENGVRKGGSIHAIAIVSAHRDKGEPAVRQPPELD